RPAAAAVVEGPVAACGLDRADGCFVVAVEVRDLKRLRELEVRVVRLRGFDAGSAGGEDVGGGGSAPGEGVGGGARGGIAKGLVAEVEGDGQPVCGAGVGGYGGEDWAQEVRVAGEAGGAHGGLVDEVVIESLDCAI